MVTGTRPDIFMSRHDYSYKANLALRISPGQKPLKDAANSAVTFTSHLFETGPVGHGDDSSVLPDQPCRLERPQHHADGGPLNPQHFGQELVGQRQVVLIDLVMGAQNPAAAAGLHGVDSIASYSLESLGEQCLREQQQQALNVRMGGGYLAQPVQSDA